MNIFICLSFVSLSAVASKVHALFFCLFYDTEEKDCLVFQIVWL